MSRRTKMYGAILVWPFQDAPEEYRKLSNHGGDEDWVAYVPAKLVKEAGMEAGEPVSLVFHWLDYLGVCDTSCHTSCHNLPDSSQIFIGAHA